MSEHLVDRTGWPVGPWDKEPDREHWVDPTTGLDCLIVRNRVGAWCGYVGVPNGHPWYGKGYDDVDVTVHGGLTFADSCDPAGGPICHTDEEAANADVWWLGFDCHHSCDKAPGHFHSLPWCEGVYRDIAYVRAQVTSLAEQCAER